MALETELQRIAASPNYNPAMQEQTLMTLQQRAQDIFIKARQPAARQRVKKLIKQIQNFFQNLVRDQGSMTGLQEPMGPDGTMPAGYDPYQQGGGYNPYADPYQQQGGFQPYDPYNPNTAYTSPSAPSPSVGYDPYSDPYGYDPYADPYAVGNEFMPEGGQEYYW